MSWQGGRRSARVLTGFLDFRYHKEERVWITRAPGMVPAEKTASYERGTYYFFDISCWRKVPKEFHLDYDKLEDRPSLPSNLASTGGATPSQGSGGGHHPVSGSPSPLVPPPPPHTAPPAPVGL